MTARKKGGAKAPPTSPAPAAAARTTAMVTALAAIRWIAHRTWEGPQEIGTDLSFDFSGGWAAYCAAERELVAALAAGELRARVCDLAPNARGQTILTPPDRSTWHDLEAQFWADHEGRVGIHPWGAVGAMPMADRGRQSPHYSGPHYGAASFRRAELMRIWPAPGAESRRPIAKVQLAQWYRDFVSRHVAERTRASVDETRQAIQRDFPDHQPPTDRQIRALRASRLTPETWKRPGKYRRD